METWLFLVLPFTTLALQARVDDPLICPLGYAIAFVRGCTSCELKQKDNCHRVGEVDGW